MRELIALLLENLRRRRRERRDSRQLHGETLLDWIRVTVRVKD